MTRPVDVDAERIRETTEAVLARPEYDLGSPQTYELDFSWLGAIFRWILSPFERLLDSIGGLPTGFQNVIVAVLLIIVVLIIAHIAYTVIVAFRRDEFTVSGLDEPRPVTVDDLAAEAQRHADAGDYVDASRALYHAALLMLEEKRQGRLRKGLTNNEYLRTFNAPWVIDNLRVFVDLINWKWYRDKSFEATDYAACRRAYEEIARRLREEFS